ncbi:hypothetical protein DICPUDRAFT_158399 [Dictyostelium purpureum]|uniref:Lipin N-terminal domain-containing protein n=1 Tax=Dictyostelium purpureum TaxID=5786 RepID=F1A1J0_DICPU|nr:uncharacterized protein DICPUDRAFT_158399 [Dictyostelium purpureum]EGC29931.1 hypothetical protein DICPUDRAFT_158399 [Dictyostelium purpureum]|eukprot:XP_003293534.1 hypothetical protein DICPUDRAFT_158399 [Dictyostelium purpureum]
MKFNNGREIVIRRVLTPRPVIPRPCSICGSVARTGLRIYWVERGRVSNRTTLYSSANVLISFLNSFADQIINEVHYAFNLNAATLSGAIDILVILQLDGSLKCTPFMLDLVNYN